MDNSWNELTEPLREVFETVNNCCGFESTTDRTNCSVSRASSAVACSTKMSQRQEKLLTWLAAALFVFAVLTFLSYLVSHTLVIQYEKARKAFKTRQELRTKKPEDDGTMASKRNESDLKTKYSIDRKDIDEESLRSVTTNDNATERSFKYLPNFMKSMSQKKVNNAPRSTGSILTYEEIASKYRSNNN